MATLNLEITDSVNDGYEVIGLALEPSDIILCGHTGAGVIVGFFRFLSVTIPQGTSITSAIFTANVTGIVGTPNTTWFGVDADNAAEFADPGNLPSNATTTTASVDGDPAGTGTRTFDLTTIVQEIIDRAGWVSGNALALVCKDNTGAGDNYWQAEDFIEAGTAHATLDITYTAASTGVPSTYRKQANARLGMRRFGW